MANVTRITQQSGFTPTQLSLIKRTVAADCNDDEFSLFIWTAAHLRLDPLRRQIYAFVFSKNDAKRRRMSIITAIDGFRAIAERTGNYRPDEDEPTYEIAPDLKGPLNPVGLVKATVRVFKFSHGAWHRVTASAYWEEYAPLKEEWAEGEDGRRRPTGKTTLDTSGNWGKMPRLMLAKVAEALALRKAWPDDFANVYAAEEVDRARAFEDATPAEVAAMGETEERLARIGAGQTILIAFDPRAPLEAVPVGKLADRVIDFVKAHEDEPAAVKAFQDRNTHGLREFWARAPGDALEVKKVVERVTAKLGAD